MKKFHHLVEFHKLQNRAVRYLRYRRKIMKQHNILGAQLLNGRVLDLGWRGCCFVGDTALCPLARYCSSIAQYNMPDITEKKMLTGV